MKCSLNCHPRGTVLCLKLLECCKRVQCPLCLATTTLRARELLTKWQEGNCYDSPTNDYQKQPKVINSLFNDLAMSCDCTNRDAFLLWMPLSPFPFLETAPHLLLLIRRLLGALPESVLRKELASCLISNKSSLWCQRRLTLAFYF